MSVRVEWYGINAYSEVELLTEGDEVGESQVDSEVALVFSGDEAGVIAGSAENLRRWLARATAALDEYDNAQAEAKGKGPCIVGTAEKPVVIGGPEAHDWELNEDGYLRTWITQVAFDADRKVIAVQATFDGTSSFSEEGTGDAYLECIYCRARLAIPDDVEIEFD